MSICVGLICATGLTWIADACVPVHVLRKIVGHGSLTTTQRCLHPDERSITGQCPDRTSQRPPVPKCVAWRKLAMLDAAEVLADLHVPPGNRLEKLAGDRAGSTASGSTGSGGSASPGRMLDRRT
jgi:hypothetical protein